MRKTGWIVVLAAAVYAGVAYWPLARTYVKIRMAAEDFVGRPISLGEQYEEIGEFIRSIEKSSGYTIYRSHLRLYRNEEGRQVVDIHLYLPVRFALIDKQHQHDLTVSATGPRSQGSQRTRR